MNRLDERSILSAVTLGIMVMILSATVTTAADSKAGESTQTTVRQSPSEETNPFPEPFNLQETAASNRDVDEVFDAVCPVEGTVRDLKIAGNRLLFESRYMEAYDCFKRALHQWFRPNTIPPSASTSANRIDNSRFKQLFPQSADIPEASFETPAALTRLLRQNNRRVFQFPGAPYQPMYPDNPDAAREDSNDESFSDEEFDDDDQQQLDALSIK